MNKMNLGGEYGTVRPDQPLLPRKIIQWFPTILCWKRMGRRDAEMTVYVYHKSRGIVSFLGGFRYGDQGFVK